MALPVPNLDDRKFQDLVSEARSMIPRFCPEWTDHNLSDPGITLIELFAWLVDTLLYRLNRVPDKNYIKFMELIGIRLEPPKPATADVVFRLSAPQQAAVTIPQGTEVATIRTETQDAIVFTTDRNLAIVPPGLAYALVSADGTAFDDCMPALKHPDKHVSIFQEPPQENNALYLGYAGDLSAHTISLTVQSSIEGIGVDPRDPPLSWEFWDGEDQRWSALTLEKDTTGGLNTNGQVVLHAPYECAMTEIDGKHACWIRCRAIATREGQRPYHKSPRVTAVASASIGGMVPASHAARVSGEVLGRSDGSPGQRFFLQNAPVLARRDGETIEVEGNAPGEYERWQEVPDFSRSGPDDLHFTCDSVSGEIEFGPSIKQTTGEERQYGAIPPPGREIRFKFYRHGGGVIGNVGPRTITVLKSSIPYVASVTNPGPAAGGTDAESMESAKMRAPRALGMRTRAVTADDFEHLALEASSEVARARCIPSGGGNGQGPQPGVVRLLLVPGVQVTDGPIPREQLLLSKAASEEVRTYLDERRLLGTRLEISAPKYVPVAVRVRIKGREGTDFARVASGIERGLYRYIHPLKGGADGKGWPFGRGISLSEVYAAIQAMGGFENIEEATLFPVDSETGEAGEPAAQVTVSIDSLLCSGKHEIEVVE